MVKVIEEDSKTITCEHCKAKLEYASKDIRFLEKKLLVYAYV